MPRFRTSLNFSSTATLNFSTTTVDDRELELLIMASIQTLNKGIINLKTVKFFRLLIDSVDDVTKKTFDKLLELLIQNQSVRLNVIVNWECLSLPKQNQKLKENEENQEKLVLMKDIGNLRLQILEEFSNMKSSFLAEVSKTSFYNHSPNKQIHGSSTSEISEWFINHLEEQLSFLKEQLRNKTLKNSENTNY